MEEDSCYIAVATRTSDFCFKMAICVRLIRGVEEGRKGVGRWGKKEIILYTYRLHCHCVSHFTVSLILRTLGSLQNSAHGPQLLKRK